MTEAVETKQDYGGDEVRRWLAALDLAGKEQKPWEDRAQKVINRYRNEKENMGEFNILWSNTETQKAAIYAQTPKPYVKRRHKDPAPAERESPVQRMMRERQSKLTREVAEILERALEYHLDAYDFDAVAKAAREDYLLSGRATVRVVYKPTFNKVTPKARVIPVEVYNDLGEIQTTYQREDTAEPVEDYLQDDDGFYVEDEPYDETVYEEANCEYVYWKDYRHGPAKKEGDIPWKAYRAYMSRSELVDRFGDKGYKVNLTYEPKGLPENAPAEQFKKSEVWEIWSKEDKKVFWISRGYPHGPLDVDDPILNFKDFYPSPKSLLAGCTNDSLVPIPEFTQYQVQADELDKTTEQINALIEELEVKGVYDASAEGLASLIGKGGNKLYPIDDWARLAEKGGLEGVVSWWPIEQIAKVLLGLYESRERTKQELYELTGLADIIRGSSNPKETATAQRIKGQFATLRLQEKQNSFAAYLRDVLRLKAEVIAEEFSAQTLSLMTGMSVTEEHLQLMRDDALRSYQIDIETDSTIAADEQADKESRVEFLTAASTFLEKALPITQSVPQMAPLMGKMLMFGIRGFKAGRELESAFEDALEQLENTPIEPQPDPEAEKRKAEVQKMQQKGQIEGMKAQQEAQMDGARFQNEQRREEQKHIMNLVKTANQIEQQK